MDSLLTSYNIKDSIAKLYVPTFIVSNERELASLKSTYASTFGKVAGTTNAVVKLNAVISSSLESTILTASGINPLSVDSASNYLLDIIEKITGKKKIKEAQKALKTLYAELRKNYDSYIHSYDENVQNIIYDIGEINTVKSIFKETVLLEVSKKLHGMGINNTLGDYHVEKLEKDVLSLDTGLKDIMSEMSALESKMNGPDSLLDSLIEYLIRMSPPLFIISNHIVARQLKEKITEFEKESSLEDKKIKADIIRIGTFNEALTNVMNIFKEIAKYLIPLIMGIINDIEKKYHDNYNEIPSAVLMALHASCKILKGMAEKNILGKDKGKEATSNDVIKYSNDLSMEYNKIKEEILKMA